MWDLDNSKVEGSAGSGEETSEEVGRGMWPWSRAGLNRGELMAVNASIVLHQRKCS